VADNALALPSARRFKKDTPMSKPPSASAAALDPWTLPSRTGSPYPEPFKAAVAGREKRALGDAFGLNGFGVNLVRLPPGCWSSQRHWHSHEDELVYLIEGELVLVTDAGEQLLTPGMVAGFPAGKADGHHMINRSGRDAIYLEIGDRLAEDGAGYPDIDLAYRRIGDVFGFTNRDGDPY
jgi:uncharacterized cupin superfamily protein